MPPIDGPVSSDPKPSAPGRKPKTTSAKSEPAPSADLVAFTVDAANGRILKVEGVDAAGAHRELSKDERLPTWSRPPPRRRWSASSNRRSKQGSTAPLA